MAKVVKLDKSKFSSCWEDDHNPNAPDSDASSFAVVDDEFAGEVGVEMRNSMDSIIEDTHGRRWTCWEVCDTRAEAAQEKRDAENWKGEWI